MSNYYSNKLNANRLMLCYKIAPPRVQQFLKAEIDFVLTHISPADHVLDLGCGYGRVTKRLAPKAKKVTGIDISDANIRLAREYARDFQNCDFKVMDAAKTDFPDHSFDKTICIQNGISAFKTDPEELLKESIRVTKNGGMILYASYAAKFWEHRLEWFQIQADYKLIGEIDYQQTKNGMIVCKDGFTATTYSGSDLLQLASKCDVEAEILETDHSSIFCKMKVRKPGR